MRFDKPLATVSDGPDTFEEKPSSIQDIGRVCRIHGGRSTGRWSPRWSRSSRQPAQVNSKLMQTGHSDLGIAHIGGSANRCPDSHSWDKGRNVVPGAGSEPDS